MKLSRIAWFERGQITFAIIEKENVPLKSSMIKK